MTQDHDLSIPRSLGIGPPLSAKDQQLESALELICQRGFSIAVPAEPEVAAKTAMM